MQKLKNILNIYKPVGISPLDAIKLLKEKYPELKNEKKIEQKISLIKGDFRQKKILSHWQKMLPKSCWSIKTVTFQTAKVKISCSSGTYIRSIAHHLGKELKTGGILLNLKRTKVGDFDIKNSEKIKSY